MLKHSVTLLISFLHLRTVTKDFTLSPLSPKPVQKEKIILRDPYKGRLLSIVRILGTTDLLNNSAWLYIYCIGIANATTIGILIFVANCLCESNGK